MSESSPMTTRIRQKLQEKFSPQLLEVINESAKHIGHAGHDGTGETHFAVHIVAEDFRGKSRVECHRMIFSLLQDELNAGVHALSISVFSPSE